MLVLVGALGLLLILVNVASAFVATRPNLQARLFGQNNQEAHTPADVGLRYERVEYAKDRWGWWVHAEHARGVVIIVHGFGLSKEPIRFAPEPLMPVVGALHARSFDALVINLGYATGAHHYTGGRAEAADIAGAVAWLSERGCHPAVVWGFSAGAHDALIAAAKTKGIAAVVADSAFVDTGEIVKQQAALAVHLPRPFLSLTPWLFRVFGGRDLDVEAVWEHASPKPALIIHGNADSAISPANAHRLAKITGGELWMVDGAGHTDAYKVAGSEYTSRGITFLEGLAPLAGPRSSACDQTS